jgi:major membrane immunogen (membrane-anchored lipoprotein)
MSNTFTTKKGSVLSLMKLKSKDYMTVANRLVWLADDVESYSTEADFVLLTEEKALAKVTLTIFNNEGKIVKKVTDFKSENKKDFSDYAEKAVTGALGRCLAQAGFGTQFAIQDLDEVSAGRIVDSPQEVPAVKLATASSTETSPELANVQDPVKKSKWKPGKKETTVAATQNDSW